MVRTLYVLWKQGSKESAFPRFSDRDFLADNPRARENGAARKALRIQSSIFRQIQRRDTCTYGEGKVTTVLSSTHIANNRPSTLYLWADRCKNATINARKLTCFSRPNYQTRSSVQVCFSRDFTMQSCHASLLELASSAKCRAAADQSDTSSQFPRLCRVRDPIRFNRAPSRIRGGNSKRNDSRLEISGKGRSKRKPNPMKRMTREERESVNASIDERG